MTDSARSRGRHLAINLLKVLLVGALMTWVFWSIEWVDTVTIINAAGEIVETRAGRILGPWDIEVVQFRAEGGDGVESIVKGEHADGSMVSATAGFATFLRNLDLGLFVAGALCYLVSLCFSSIRWWWLLRVNRVDLTPLDALRYTWIGVFFNNVVPGQTGGDVVKALYIMKRAGSAGRVAAIVSVIVDRILGLASLAILGAVVVLFYLDRFPSIAIGIWAVLLGVGVVGTIAFSRRVRRFIRLDTLLRKLPMSGLLQRIDQAVHFYRGHKAGISLWLLLGVGNHAISVCSVLLIGTALHVGMPELEYFVLIPVINIVSAVPIAPNGWGVGEALYKSLFGLFGAEHLAGSVANPERVMATRGVALSILYRIHLTMWSLVGGVFMLLEKERVTRADVEEEIAREDADALV